MPTGRSAHLLLLASLVVPASVLAARQVARKAGVVPASPSAIEPTARIDDRARAVGAEMQNVDFHIDSGIVLRIVRLRGELVPTNAAAPPRLDDKLSFILSIRTAEISIDTVSLSTLLNRHVFGYPGSPLKRLHVGIDGDQLVQTGVMHKGVDMPFRIRTTIATSSSRESFDWKERRSTLLSIREKKY